MQFCYEVYLGARHGLVTFPFQLIQRHSLLCIVSKLVAKNTKFMSLSLFQAAKSGNNGLGSVIESSGSQLIEVVSWSMICFPSQLFKSLGDWLMLTLDILKRKFTTQPLVKSPRLLSWPGLVWKNSMEMENNRFEREWVSTQRSRVRRLTGRRGYGHHWSPLVRVWISFFPRHILPLCFVVDPTNKASYFIHWSRLINLEVIHSLMILRFATLVWRSVQTEGICTIAQLHMSTTISSDHCWWKMQSLSCC